MSRAAAALGTAAGAGSAMLARIWTRLISSTPEFSSTGTLATTSGREPDGRVRLTNGRTLRQAALLGVLLFASACSGAGNNDRASNGATTGDTPNVEVTVRHVDGSAHPIVFTSMSSGSLDLWLLKADGTDPVQFTAGPDTELMPAWSPDGSQVAFVATKDIDTGPSDIYVVNADGSKLQLLTPTDDCATVPSWSPDGQSMLFVGGECGGDQFVFTMDRDGGNVRQLNDDLATWPDWSPDGRIIYEAISPNPSASALVVTHNQGKNPTPLYTGDLPSGSEATWSPDGSQIAYVALTGDPNSENEQEWNEDIFVINADGTGGRRVVRTPGNDHWPPAWSPDGKRLLYTADGVGNSTKPTLMVVDLKTLRVTPFAAEACTCALADWRR